MTQSFSEPALRALILAPSGRDSAVASGLLDRANLETAVCRDLTQLVALLNDTTAFVLLTEEAMRSSDLKSLATWVNAQPAWSDLPFILMTHHGGGPERNPAAARFLESLGNVSFIERPFHPTTLLSVVRATIKSRQRQIEARELLGNLQVSQARLQQLNDELERRVNERSRQLQRAHDELVAQIAERARTEEQLRHVQKIESIGELTGGVAHDFNNLLTAVLGNLELLRKRLPPDPATDRLIDGAMQGAQRGASLTQRLLAFARRQALEPRPVDLVDLVRGMTDLLRRSIGPSIEIAIDLPAGLPPALADANQIELGLLNLAVNARDAMPSGGAMSIGLAVVESGSAPDLDAGRYLRLSVADTGVGMDEATLRRAIEPFFSTKEVGKGTGLGLSMVYGIVKQTGGYVFCESAPGAGASFRILLPRHVSAEIALPEKKKVATKPATDLTGQGAILLVEDEEAVRAFASRALQSRGYTVLEAESGVDALRVFEEVDGKIDLIVSDVIMPEMDGPTMLTELRKKGLTAKIIFVSGYADDAFAKNLPEGQEFIFLPKPFSLKQLVETVKGAMS